MQTQKGCGETAQGQGTNHSGRIGAKQLGVAEDIFRKADSIQVRTGFRVWSQQRGWRDLRTSLRRKPGVCSPLLPQDTYSCLHVLQSGGGEGKVLVPRPIPLPGNLAGSQ